MSGTIITDILFVHRPVDGNNESVYNDYTYDGLNRLDEVGYLVGDNGSTDDDTESFAMDDLDNRDGSQILRDVTVGYTVNDDTNRYDAN